MAHIVLVTQRFFDEEARAYLRAHGCEARIAEPPLGRGEGDLTTDDLLPLLEGAGGWIVGHAHVTRELLEARPDLRIVARRGVGHERVDLAAARELGRVVTIATGGNAPSVADLAIGLMLGVGRRLRESHAMLEGGRWTILPGTELYRKTVGIVGLGRIGRQLVQRLRGFECRILVHAPRVDSAFATANGIEIVDLPTLLAESDYVSLHAPLLPQTRHMIDAGALAAMKRGAILINTARSGLVSEPALLAALKSGHLGGAGLDVLDSESDPGARPLADELLALPNVLATPHAAASTTEGLRRSNMIASRCIAAVLTGGDPPAECVVADGRPR